MQTTPFKRANILFRQIQHLRTTLAPIEAQVAIAALPVYVSRGHGRGDKFARQNFVTSSPKYKPHQGKRECARRAAQLAKAG